MNLFKDANPLEKYIREVKSYLPRNSREDIGEELRANFEEKIADMESAAGEPLNNDAVIELLSDYGHPVRVAAQYQGSGKSLIGPDFYPYYRIAVLSSLGISTAIILVLLGIDLLYSLDIGDVSRLWMFVNTYIYIIGIITGAFVITERVMEKSGYLVSWSPNNSAPPNQAVADAWGAIFAVCALVTWLVILNLVNMNHSLSVLFGNTGNPFHTFVYWLKITTVLLIPQYFYQIFNQVYNKSRLYLRIGTELLLLVGCITTLLVDTAELRTTYPDLPEGLFTMFNWIILAFMVAIFIEIYVFWRKLTTIEDSGDDSDSDSGKESEINTKTEKENGAASV
ncbi:MAG: hypothetical protein GKR91_05645 [Pseudomonadales bacterium]|nr:hypothetical protein [Pseudomonadales bacterium]